MPQLHPTGALKDPHDKRDIKFSSLVPPGSVQLPRKFSLRDKMSPVPMQKYGSCVGFAGKNWLEYYLLKLTGVLKLVSGRFIYAISKKQDGYYGEGTWPRLVLKGIFGVGAPEDSQWPQEPSPTHEDYIKMPPDDIYESAIVNLPTGGFARIETAEELKQAIYMFGPAFVTLAVFDTYDAPEADGFIGKRKDINYYRGNHENICLGWDDDMHGVGAWEIKNNWGEGWADHGYGWMAYDYNGLVPFTDMWSVNDMINSKETSGAPIELGYPVETSNPVVTQVFGARPEYYAKYGMKGHNGVDFRTYDLKNRYIIAADDGEVILAGNDGGYGLAVRIKHSWGISIYGHNSKLLVSADNNAYGELQKVKKGQRIAIPGSTGDADGEHCHFGIRINGVKNPGYFDWVDPTPYFRKTNMKNFKIKQGGKMGIMILEGFSGTVLFENDWAEYQTLLKISGFADNTPVVEVPAGRFFRIDDHGKKGILVLDGFAGTVLFENDWNEYKQLLAISGITDQNPEIMIP